MLSLREWIYCITFEDDAAIASAIILIAFFGIIVHNFASYDSTSNAKRRQETFQWLEAQTVMTLFIAIFTVDYVFIGRYNEEEMGNSLQVMSTLTKMIVFAITFLPFIAGCLLSLFSTNALFLLVIPLSSLTICVVTGLYQPSLINAAIAITFLLIGLKIIQWTFTVIYRVYTWIVEINTSMAVSFTLVALIMFIISGK